MRYCSLMMAVAAGLLFILPLAAQDAKKPDPAGAVLGDEKKDVKETKEAKKNILPWKRLTNFSGKVMQMDQGKLTVQVTYTYTAPVADAVQRKINYANALADYQRRLAQRQQDIARRQFNLQRQRNPLERQRQLLDLQRIMNQPILPPQQPQLYEQKSATKDIEIRTSDKLIVRSATPELQYDDRGNLVQLTPEKLKSLAGSEGYPGFPATLSDIGQDSLVHVFLAPPKGQDPKKKGPSIADILGGTDAGKSGPEQLVDTRLPEAIMIVVLPNTQLKQ